MTRTSSSAIATAVAAAHAPYAVFIDLAFDSGHSRVCSGYRSYTFTDSFGSNTYSGIGQFGSIDQVKESAQLVPEKVSLQLTGVDSSLLTTALAENYRGRSATIYIGYLTSAGDLVDTPYLFWEGRMDVMTVQADQNSSVVKLVCENRLILWNKSLGFLYTVEHRALLTGISDNFFDLLSVLPNRPLRWADSTVGFTPTGPPILPQPPQPGAPIILPGGAIGQ